jgi:hypothetical protein
MISGQSRLGKRACAFKALARRIRTCPARSAFPFNVWVSEDNRST